MNATLCAAIGYAADDTGNGVAYVRAGEGARSVLRVPFSVKRFPGLQGREVGYAALRAAAIALQKRGVVRASLHLEDDRLAGDLNERRDVPAPLTLAYVRLRCALNQFASYSVHQSAESDLAQRARSELALHVAA